MQKSTKILQMFMLKIQSRRHPGWFKIHPKKYFLVQKLYFKVSFLSVFPIYPNLLRLNCWQHKPVNAVHNHTPKNLFITSFCYQCISNKFITLHLNTSNVYISTTHLLKSSYSYFKSLRLVVKRGRVCLKF